MQQWGGNTKFNLSLRTIQHYNTDSIYFLRLFCFKMRETLDGRGVGDVVKFPKKDQVYVSVFARMDVLGKCQEM